MQNLKCTNAVHIFIVVTYTSECDVYVKCGNSEFFPSPGRNTDGSGAAQTHWLALFLWPESECLCMCARLCVGTAAPGPIGAEAAECGWPSHAPLSFAIWPCGFGNVNTPRPVSGKRGKSHHKHYSQKVPVNKQLYSTLNWLFHFSYKTVHFEHRESWWLRLGRFVLWKHYAFAEVDQAVAWAISLGLAVT